MMSTDNKGKFFTYDELYEWIDDNYRTPKSELSTIREIRRSQGNIFNLSSSTEFFTDDRMLQRKKLSFNAVLVNKQRYWDYPIHTHADKKEIDYNYTNSVEDNYTHVNEHRRERLAMEKIL